MQFRQPLNLLVDSWLLFLKIPLSLGVMILLWRSLCGPLFILVLANIAVWCTKTYFLWFLTVNKQLGTVSIFWLQNATQMFIRLCVNCIWTAWPVALYFQVGGDVQEFLLVSNRFAIIPPANECHFAPDLEIGFLPIDKQLWCNLISRVKPYSEQYTILRFCTFLAF